MEKKTIIITGSEGKIGKKLKNYFLKKNFNVAGIDLKKGFKTFKCDITKEKKVKQTLQYIFSKSKPSVLINNASIIPKIKKFKFSNYKIKDWKKTIDVDLIGSFNVTKECTKFFEKQNKGTIINISSIYGLVGPDQKIYGKEIKYHGYKPLEYSVAKAGIIGFTKSLASFYKGTNVKVICLILGGVNDPKHNSIFLKKYLNKSLTNRMITTDEICRFVEICIENPTFINGSCLKIDGGVTTII